MYRNLVTLSALLLAACSGVLPFTPGDLTPEQTGTVTAPTETFTLTPTPVYPWSDESAVMSGICFEAANAVAGQIFTLRSAEDHIHFYDQMDNLHLCRHPVKRLPFDFSTGRILVGLWSKGSGCTARHDVLGIDRSDPAKTFTIRLKFVTEGDCNYELLRPFWIGLDGIPDYVVVILVT